MMRSVVALVVATLGLGAGVPATAASQNSDAVFVAEAANIEGLIKDALVVTKSVISPEVVASVAINEDEQYFGPFSIEDQPGNVSESNRLQTKVDQTRNDSSLGLWQLAHGPDTRRPEWLGCFRSDGECRHEATHHRNFPYYRARTDDPQCLEGWNGRNNYHYSCWGGYERPGPRR